MGHNGGIDGFQSSSGYFREEGVCFSYTTNGVVFPMKITVTKEGNGLVGQASGQSSFPLEAFEKDKFRFDQAALTMEFFPEDHRMILRQSGQVFELTRED